MSRLSDSGTATIQTGDNGAVDAFGRVRVSGVGNRFDTEFNYGGQQDIVDFAYVGTGTATFNSNARHHVLSVGGTAGTASALISSYDVPYTPGNSQLIAITGALDFAAIGSGTAQVFLRSNVTGTVTTTAVDQTSWDDPVANVDWTKTQIFEMDFQSLKVGRIRFYLNRGGVATPVHEITNDNVRNTGYWQNPNHPAYWRVYNDSTITYMEVGYGDTNNAIGFRYAIALNASATMSAICASVKSEGGLPLFEIPGYNRSIDRGVTAKTISTTILPLISIRPKSTYNSLPNKAISIPIDYSIQTDNSIRVIAYHSGTVGGASWTDVDTADSVMEYDVSGTAISGGRILSSDYVASIKNTANSNTGIMGRAILWNRRGTETGVLTIAAVKSGATDAAVLAAVRWREIR